MLFSPLRRRPLAAKNRFRIAAGTRHVIPAATNPVCDPIRTPLLKIKTGNIVRLFHSQLFY
jgi:hypothetical protein